MMEKDLQDILIQKKNLHKVDKYEKVNSKSDIWLLNQLQNVIENNLQNFESSEQKIDFLNEILNDDQAFSKYVFKNNKTFARTSEQLSLNSLIVSFGDYIEEEFLSSKQVLMISPFISSYMINKLRVWMINNSALKVKILTTTYDGTSRFLSLETLVELKKEFGDRVEVRIENSFKNKGSRIHIKAYCFIRNNQFSNLYVGSNNFTKTGIMLGNEYSIKISQFREKAIFTQFIAQFNLLWNNDLIDIEDQHSINLLISKQIIIDAIERKKDQEIDELLVNLNRVNQPIELFDYQKEVIETISKRELNNLNKHLIVMATGTGKTLTVAKYFEKVLHENEHQIKLLFIAHQKEILDQAIETFNSVVPGFKSQAFQYYDSRNSDINLSAQNYVFSTFQSLNKQVEQLKQQKYDLVIFDEVHHIEAKTFNEIYAILAANTKTIIGLTATPERTEGVDVSKYFNFEYAYELSLYEALNKQLLASFDYFYVEDKSVDLKGVDISKQNKLGQILSDQSRNAFIYQHIKKTIGVNNRNTSTVLFCASKEHAFSLEKYLSDNQLRCKSLTSSNTKAEREKILTDFRNKEINYLCVRDILNEGIDIPDIETIMLLRPTASLLIYMQQIGRGLRKRQDKKLQIYDFVNNVDLYVNKTYDPFLLYKAFKNHNDLKINDLVNEKTRLDVVLPDGSNIYLNNLLYDEIIKKIKSFEKNKQIGSVLKAYQNELTYQNYQNLFLENSHLDEFSPFKVYDKNKAFILENEKYANVLKNIAINNFRPVLTKWQQIITSKQINLNTMPDKLLMTNFCNSGLSRIDERFEKDLASFWSFILEQKELIKEIDFLIRYKLANESLIEKFFVNENDVNEYKNMYTSFDQIKILMGAGIENNVFVKNAIPQGIYNIKDNKYVIGASSLTKHSIFKHENFFNENTKILSWDSPDNWSFDKPEKIDLVNNKYYVFYQSTETVSQFNAKIKKFIGEISAQVSKNKIENPKYAYFKIKYEFLIN